MDGDGDEGGLEPTGDAGETPGADPGPPAGGVAADGDDFFAATPGLRRGLTAAGFLAMAVGVLDAAVNGSSLVAGFTLALGGGLVWTVWRGLLPTRYRVGWLAWLVAAGIALGWPGRPAVLLPALAGLGLGVLVPTVLVVRDRQP